MIIAVSLQLTKHDVILRFAVHVSLVQISREDFNITTSAVDLLLMFYRELNHQSFTFIAERLELTGESIKSGILACLKTWNEQKSILENKLIYKYEALMNVVRKKMYV